MKKKKIIITIVIIAVIIIFALIGSNLLGAKKTKEKVSDFKNIKELVEYYGCTYISTKKSAEQGYSKDIKINFKLPPITEEGITNRLKYEGIVSSLATKMENEDFRIIDESRNIEIKVNFYEYRKAHYIINNDPNYFEHLESSYSLDNQIEESLSNIEISSEILRAIKNNNWKTINLNLGTIDSNMNKYDIYFDEGYKIRKINGKVYNIVFTKQYRNRVINNLYTTSTFEQIRQILGKESYSNHTENLELIGYKGNEMYVFFSENEISIYPIEQIEGKNEFAELVTSLSENGKKEEFISRLTDLWPDYSEYTKEGDTINIKYPLKGVEIDFRSGSERGIVLYSNYDGQVTNSINIQQIKESKTMPANINLRLEQNMVHKVEFTRAITEKTKRQPVEIVSVSLRTNKYTVYLNSTQNTCEFYSNDSSNINSSITVEGLNEIYNLNDTIFIYGISGKGIYAYEATNKKTTQIVSGSKEYKIKEVKDRAIYYDEEQITINIQ